MSKAKSIAFFIARRLREPSTLAGISALAVLAGVPAGVPEVVAHAVAGVAAALAVLIPERSGDA